MSTARPPGDTFRLAGLYNTCMWQLRPFVAGPSLWQSQITTEYRIRQKPLSLVLRSSVVNKQRSKLGRSNGEGVATVEIGRRSECWSSKIKVGNDFQAIMAPVQSSGTAIPCCQTHKRATGIVVGKPPRRSKIASARNWNSH